MVPILFEKTETAFTSNGLGRLADATRCEVTEERNGLPELILEYPLAGPLFSKLVVDNYIYATHDDSKTLQPYQIYSISQPLQGVVTVKAWHMAYNLRNCISGPFTAASLSETLSKIPGACINACPFNFWTDKSVATAFSLNVPRDVWALLGGSAGSLLDIYGKAEYEFDKFTVKMHLNRGANRGVSIRYGKNLTSLDKQIDASNVYNAVVPYWISADKATVVQLDHLVVRTGATAGRAQTLDLSADFTEAPTEAQLEARAQSIVDGSSNYTVKENIAINFVQLWQTEEYKDVASLQRVRLCDTVNVFYSKAGVNATAKVIKVVYDSLKERYISMELGEPKTTLTKQITESVESAVLPQVPSTEGMLAAIDKATKLITGKLGGYAVWHYNSDGTPKELLFMDAPSEGTAQNVLRINNVGIGFSTNGVAGPYATAWTIDGSFNADFITAGTMVADRIFGGVLTLGGANNGNGTLRVLDSSGNVLGTLDKDGLLIVGSTTKSSLDGGRLRIENASDNTKYVTFESDANMLGLVQRMYLPATRYSAEQFWWVYGDYNVAALKLADNTYEASSLDNLQTAARSGAKAVFSVDSAKFVNLDVVNNIDATKGSITEIGGTTALYSNFIATVAHFFGSLTGPQVGMNTNSSALILDLKNVPLQIKGSTSASPNKYVHIYPDYVETDKEFRVYNNVIKLKYSTDQSSVIQLGQYGEGFDFVIRSGPNSFSHVYFKYNNVVVPQLTIGSTSLTEAQLMQLKALIS